VGHEIDEAWIEQAIERYQRIATLQADFDRALTKVDVTVRSPDGLVEIVVGADGVIRDVVIPSALPETFTGIRLAVGMAYSSVVAAELFNGIPGIGGLVKDASNYNNTPVVLVGIFAIGFSGLVIDGLLRAAERRAVPWRGKL